MSHRYHLLYCSLLWLLCLSGGTNLLQAQGAPLPLGDPGYDLVRRLIIRYGFGEHQRPATDLSLQPTDRATLVRIAKTLYAEHEADLSAVDRYRLQVFFDQNNEFLSVPDLRRGNVDPDRAVFSVDEGFATTSADSPYYRRSERPIFNTFYETPAHLLEFNQTDFYLRVNPILDVRYGKQRDDSEDYFLNRRGVRLRAGIDDRFYLSFDILETQVGLPNYVRAYRNQFGSLPGAGFLKDFEAETFNVRRGNDFLNGTGTLSIDISRHVGARLGYGQHFIGDGERSLLLSDFSNNYPFLELNWRIWKFHYRNLFAELTAEPQGTSGAQMPLQKKYLANHHLTINIGQRLTVGLMESVVLSREDGFDLAYLNPIILYRTIEQSVGSPDNALIALTGRYRLPKWRTEVYGQFVLDEFVFDELFIERRGWWGNKWAYQFGARHVDAFGLDQLDVVVERNVARPFIYTHLRQSSYTHFALPLAHPLGANFTENVVGFDYRPLPRLAVSGRLYLLEQGEEGVDPASPVTGANINLRNRLRAGDFGYELKDGVFQSTTLLQLRGGYELFPDFWLEGELLSREKDSELDTRDLSTFIINAGVRWNVARRREAF